MANNDLIRFERLLAPRPDTLRVLFVTNMWPDERRPYYGSFIASQARSLVASDVPIDVVYVRGFLGVHAYLRALRELPRFARRESYDIVHVHYGHTIAAGLGISSRPLVYSFCGEDLLGAPRDTGITAKSRVEVAVFRQLAALATATITKSADMELALPARLRQRNFVLPNGVDTEAFRPRPRAEARRELGWALESNVMLFLGDPDDPRKNLALAQEAARIVQSKRPDSRLEVVWGVSPERVPLIMNAADCLVFASRSEGSPNVVKEAMASALPVVSTPVGDVKERLAGVDGCFVVKPTGEDFATAIERAFDAGESPSARVAVAKVNSGNVAKRLIDIYEVARLRHRVRGHG